MCCFLNFVSERFFALKEMTFSAQLTCNSWAVNTRASRRTLREAIMKCVFNFSYSSKSCICFYRKFAKKKKHSVAGNRTPVSRVTGGDTYHYTTTDWLISGCSSKLELLFSDRRMLSLHYSICTIRSCSLCPNTSVTKLLWFMYYTTDVQNILSVADYCCPPQNRSLTKPVIPPDCFTRCCTLGNSMWLSAKSKNSGFPASGL